MIFVDPLVEYGADVYRAEDRQAARVGSRNGHRWCHLFSDETDPEFPALRLFAKRLGLKVAWFQGDHFDLTPGRREVAVRYGAREVTRHEAVEIWRHTPRARRRRCKACGYVTERVVTPPPVCPGCGRSAT